MAWVKALKSPVDGNSVMTDKARVLLADDNEAMLSRLKVLLGRDFEVVGAVSDGQAMLDAALKLKPELIVLDISMPVLNGIDAARHLKAISTSKVVFLSVSKLRFGIDLIPALKGALIGRCFVSPGLK
jgi:CheY-like chemotaxis protein